MKKLLKSKKGFTLMELIIVLVIVAILAAALIPSFLNFVSRAQQESLYGDARVGMVAAQLLITESGAPVGGTLTTFPTLEDFVFAVGTTTDNFIDLVEYDVDNYDPSAWTDITIAATGRIRVTGLTYTDTNGESVTIPRP